MDKDKAVQHFLDLIKRSRRGKFKIYIGLNSWVGKSYRMLQEARTALKERYWWKERVPDSVLAQADKVVNIDLTADELITRLKKGEIYQAEKIETALKNFFNSEHILRLRELAFNELLKTLCFWK